MESDIQVLKVRRRGHSSRVAVRYPREQRGHPRQRVAATVHRAGIAPLPEIFALNLVPRLGRGGEVGAAAVWPASDGAECITGQTIHVNAGAYPGR